MTTPEENKPPEKERLKLEEQTHPSAAEGSAPAIPQPANALLPKSPEKQAKRSTGWRIIDGMLFIAAIVVVKFALELTGIIKEYEARTVTTLEERLGPHKDAYELPVVIFDISGINRIKPAKGFGVARTDRESIITLVKALEACTPGPRAIAVDVDFSNAGGQPLDGTNDKILFEDARKLIEKNADGSPRIYFGVGRQVFASPGKFLPHGGTDEMAGGIQLGSVPWRMPASFAAEGARDTLPSLGERLASRLRPAPSRPVDPDTLPFWQRWLSEFTPAHCADGSYVIERTIDLSQIGGIRDARICVAKGQETAAIQMAGPRLNDSVVLIGNGIPLDNNDRVRLPGYGDNDHDLAGVYFHACAAITPNLGPLYELTHRGRLGADIVLSTIVFAIISSCTYWQRKNEDNPDAERNLHLLVTLVAILLIVVVGYFLVPYTRLLWIDYDLVAVALLFHRPFEDRVEKFGHFVSGLVGGKSDEETTTA